jgi:hypothetical protein
MVILVLGRERGNSFPVNQHAVRSLVINGQHVSRRKIQIKASKVLGALG